MWWNRRIAVERQSEYATGEDFRKLFSTGLNSLYRLSFLLTANHEMAEQCFVAGLDDCVDGNPVFRKWADSWVRHVIARNAVRTMAPFLDDSAPVKDQDHPTKNVARLQLSNQEAQFAHVLALDDLERIVFVLSILERYTDLECATLLHSSSRAIRAARTRALNHLADHGRIAAKPGKNIMLNPISITC